MPAREPAGEGPKGLDAQPAPGAPFKLIALDEVDSTSTMAKRLCAAEAEDRTLVWAKRQTAGRGRLGRTWISPAGNLYVSLVLRPDADAARATGLTFAAAVAVAEAVEELLGPSTPVRCKWPNDVLASGRKVAGILLESSTSATGRLEWVVIGIGVNVGSHPPDGETMYPATSLAAEGAPGVGVEQALGVLCRRLDLWLRRWADEGFAAIRRAWLDRAHGLGAAIAVRAGDDAVLEGLFLGLDEDGALTLDEAGVRRRVTAGDVLPGPSSPRPFPLDA